MATKVVPWASVGGSALEAKGPRWIRAVETVVSLVVSLVGSTSLLGEMFTSNNQQLLFVAVAVGVGGFPNRFPEATRAAPGPSTARPGAHLLPER